MRVSLLTHVPYRRFADGFESEHQAVITTPYSLADPAEIAATFFDALDNAMLAARQGFDGLAFLEHSQSSYDMAPNPSLMATTVAYQTEAEGLPVAVFPTGRSLGKTREPLRIAEEYAVIDAVSNGRLMAGFPVGLPYDAAINHGVPPVEIRERFEEGFGLVRRAWSAREPFAFNGRFSQRSTVNPWPRPVQEPHPPIWLMGVGSPGTMKRVAHEGFGYQLGGVFGAKVTGSRLFEMFWRFVEEAGHEPNPYRLGFMQPICVAESMAEAERLYAPHVEYFYRRGIGNSPPHLTTLAGTVPPPGLRHLLKNPDAFAARERLTSMSFREFVDAGCVIIGSPEKVADEITQITEEYRIGHLLAICGFGSIPRSLARQNITMFAEQVLPRIRDLWPESRWPNHWWPTRLGGVSTDGESTAQSVPIVGGVR
jgi:alkanesulfonate monooxygenase SsuD/methylene tetrahydromethanopterin reductase-like flavin-dependent oxidoreductase (luciferase family)